MRCEGDDQDAAAVFEEALVLGRQLGSAATSAWALHNLGHLALHEGDQSHAARCFAESLQLARVVGQPHRIAASLAGMAGVLAARGEARRAARLLGAALAQDDALDLAMHPADRREYEVCAAALRRALGEAACVAACAEGNALSVDEAIADALRAAEENAAAGAPEKGPVTAGASRAALPGNLTAREAEVLRLVAAGTSNREIAAALVISEGTVERHIHNLYAKIGARGRADATAYAFRHALIPPTDA